MELVVTHRGRLVDMYGKDGWNTVRRAVDDYLDALESVGFDADLFLVDEIVPPQEGSVGPEEKAQAIKAESTAIKLALDDWCTEQGTEYLVILGGDDIIPFFRLSDETDDNVLDPYIFSDSFYVDFVENEHEHWPMVSVGRLPNGGNTDTDLLVQQIQRAAELHRSDGAPLPKETAGFAAEVWETASKDTYSRIDMSLGTLHFSPPLGLQKRWLEGVTQVIEADAFPLGGILFFNLHGHRSEPLWMGSRAIAGIQAQTPDLVDFELFQTADLTDCVLFCEACHSAAIHGRTPENSLALCALQQGAIAFFGCTVKSYSARMPDGIPYTASGIDSIFYDIILNVVRHQMRFGEALRDAKQRYGLDNGFDDKNAFGLVLLGDPMLHFKRE